MGFRRNNFESCDSVEDDVTLPEPDEKHDFDYDQWEADLATEDYDEFATDSDLDKEEDEPEGGDEPEDDFVNDTYNPDAVEVDSQDTSLESSEAVETGEEQDDFKDDLYDPDGVDVDDTCESSGPEIGTEAKDPGDKDFANDVYDPAGHYDSSTEQDVKDGSTSGEKRFEDYSSEELGELARTDPETARALNEEYQERVSADKLGMTPEEYRAHLQRIEDANGVDDNNDSNVSTRKADVDEYQTNSRFEITPEIQEALTTEPDTAYFWSGLGPNGQYVAREKAMEAGGTTLENQLDVNNIDMPEWSFLDENSQKAWRDVSACYADNCSGEVNVFAGKIREGSVFESTEYDRLVNNENVTSISLVDVETGDRQTIYDRNNPENNANKVVYEENGQYYIRFVKGAELGNEVN